MNKKRIQNVIHYLGDRGEESKRRYRRAVGEVTPPNFTALTASSSSFPVETVAIFLVLDDLKISSRSHGKIEIPSPMAKVSAVSTLLLSFATYLSTHPRFPLYASTPNASIPMERAQG